MRRESSIAPTFRCVLHGSFRRHFEEIQRVHRLFTQNGIEVLAPSSSTVTSTKEGFAFLETDQEEDPRVIELRYLHHLKRLDENGFSYFVNPEGYIGKSVSYELGIAQVSNVRCFFQEPPRDHPAFVQRNALWTPESFVAYTQENGRLPEPTAHPDERRIQRLWEALMVPGSVVAVGGIIRNAGDVLLVKTHKWGGQYSIVGGRVRRHERIDQALLREIGEETGLRGRVGAHLCTFDQLKHSGYYHSGIQHVFIDKVVDVERRQVRLNEEAQDYVWVPPNVALQELPVEPNARFTLEQYVSRYI